MNAVEIEQAITDLAEQPFDPAEFPYAFLEAFGNKATTIKRLRAGASNKSDLGGVLQTSNIHILTCDAGQVGTALDALRASPATARAKAKFILATDGADFEAEDLGSGETVACAFKDFPDHFGFFLPLAGISTVRQISENAFDIRATSRLNRLYVELLKDNPEWGTAERSHDMNHFMARLIFCFFAEDTDIFIGKGRFTDIVAQMSERDASNTHEVIATLFRAMNTPPEARNRPPTSAHPATSNRLSANNRPSVNNRPSASTSPRSFCAERSGVAESTVETGPCDFAQGDCKESPGGGKELPSDGKELPSDGKESQGDGKDSPAFTKLPRWAAEFPYVNGALFSGSDAVPRFSKIARSYLLHVGNLDWTRINPDIFGSMIQAIAEDTERGELGMHYTSVPNILKVLNPLFLDDLRAKLAEAGDNPRTLLNLRKRMARIRVFDPACGSGNFLVIAYKEMRAIEAEINNRRGEPHRKSDIPLTNFRGIELLTFPAEIARLALVIAEYQCDERYRGQKLALAEFLPLSHENWITCGNALRLDWLSVCPPTGKGVKLYADDLFETPADQSEIDFANEGGETYICGNPPYLGSRDQKEEQKSDLRALFNKRVGNWKSLDYVAGWWIKAAEYCTHTEAIAAFVSTNSICQGLQVPVLWPAIFSSGCQIDFAYTSFRWANLASHNAGVTVAIVGITTKPRSPRRLFSLDGSGNTIERQGLHINAYLALGETVIVAKASQPLSALNDMTFGNTPIDGGLLLLSRDERDALQLTPKQQCRFVRRIVGSAEFIRGLERYCLWIEDQYLAEAQAIPSLAQRIRGVRDLRLHGGKTARDIAERPHQFQRMLIGKNSTLVVPSVSSETREYLPCGYEPAGTVVSNLAFALYDAPLWNMALIASRLHLVWIATVCGKLETRYRYSNTLGWNTFPVPLLTDQNKIDLTRCAEDILLTRERHFPATIADLYNPDNMPADLRAAHDRNDEVLERIYIGRRFRNDTERLEKLFDLYTKMVASAAPAKGKKRKTGANA